MITAMRFELRAIGLRTIGLCVGFLREARSPKPFGLCDGPSAKREARSPSGPCVGPSAQREARSAQREARSAQRIALIHENTNFFQGIQIPTESCNFVKNLTMQDS
jgi:hypothetical protein